MGGAKLADGAMLPANGQLAGKPSVLFDAVAVILSDEGAKALSVESAAIDRRGMPRLNTGRWGA